VKLTNCGITIDVNALEAPRYMAAGYVEVKESVEMPTQDQSEPEAVIEPKARKSAKRKG
jgi:hypothetical protein